MTPRLELQETQDSADEAVKVISLNKGDKIKVCDPNSDHHECTGIVVSSNPGRKGVRVRLDGFPRDEFFPLKILELSDGDLSP
ncbi:hypothetical protein ACFL14_00950 [Patescibacteria group bacterium]